MNRVFKHCLVKSCSHNSANHRNLNNDVTPECFNINQELIVMKNGKIRCYNEYIISTSIEKDEEE
jgi:hypothetical protein